MRELSENERELLAIVWRAGRMPRSDVNRHTRLAQQSVHRLLDGLREARMLSFGEAGIRGRGKPSPSVEIDGSHHTTVGLAINAEGMRYCVADLRGTPLVQGQLEAEPNDRPAVLAELERLLAGWRAGLLAGRNLIGMGLACQGYRTGPDDVFQPIKRLSSWRDVPLEALFRDRFGLPAFVENNASSSVVAEHFFGGGGGHDCFAYLSFNYGFGSGLMWQRRVFVGAHGNAGEMGPLFTEAQKPVRPALSGLIARLRAEGLQIATPAELARDFRPDWPGVRDWLEEIGPQMQLTVRALKAVADPGAIFFGGDAPAALRAMLIDVAGRGFGREASPSPLLLPSGIEGDASHLGAAFLPLHRQIY